MKRLTLATLALATLAVATLAGTFAFAGSASAPGAIGGPAKQTTGIGGPAKSTTLMPSQKAGAAAVSPVTQNACVNCVKKSKK